jgi:hypothetical protein
MNNISLHKAVGDLLEKFANKNNLKTRLDPACGGEQYVPLFMADEAHLETRLCCVDAMLLKNGKVAAVIEIEESDIKPTQICGKYLTAAMSKKYIHENESLALKDVCFIQILDISSLKKKKQAESINSLTKKNFLHGCVKDYRMICIDWEEKGDIKELENELYNILGGI